MKKLSIITFLFILAISAQCMEKKKNPNYSKLEREIDKLHAKIIQECTKCNVYSFAWLPETKNKSYEKAIENIEAKIQAIPAMHKVWRDKLSQRALKLREDFRDNMCE